MAAFATFEACETRAKLKIVDGTWINAFSTRGFLGTLGVRVQRKMSPTHPDYGIWTFISDDGTA